MISLVCQGVFERFPGLKVVICEGGIAWLPDVMWRLDKDWRSLRDEVPWLKRLPSEYILDHVRLTTQPFVGAGEARAPARAARDRARRATLLYSSDYPHWDFDHPERALAGVPHEMRSRVFHSNAQDLRRRPPALGSVLPRRALALSAGETSSVRSRDRRAWRHAKLGEDVLDVRPHRLGADHEPGRDRRLGLPVGKQLENLALSFRQPGRVPPRDDARPLEQAPDAGEELAVVERLRKVVVGSELETGDAIARLDAVAGHEQDRQIVSELVAELAADLVPRAPGKPTSRITSAGRSRRARASPSSPVAASEAVMPALVSRCAASERALRSSSMIRTRPPGRCVTNEPPRSPR